MYLWRSYGCPRSTRDYACAPSPGLGCSSLSPLSANGQHQTAHSQSTAPGAKAARRAAKLSIRGPSTPFGSPRSAVVSLYPSTSVRRGRRAWRSKKRRSPTSPRPRRSSDDRRARPEVPAAMRPTDAFLMYLIVPFGCWRTLPTISPIGHRTERTSDVGVSLRCCTRGRRGIAGGAVARD